jgi:hypothetical protein
VSTFRIHPVELAAINRQAAACRAALAAITTCTCLHDYDEHAGGTGRCRERDSYGIDCACPSPEPWQTCFPDDDADR